MYLWMCMCDADVTRLTKLGSTPPPSSPPRWYARNVKRYGIVAPHSLRQISYCSQKLSKVAAPDPFTSSSSSIKDGSRKVGENKLLTRPGSSKNRFQVKSRFLVDMCSNNIHSRIKGNVKIASRQSPRIKQSTVMVRYHSSCLSNLFPLTSSTRISGCAYKKGLCSICGKQILDTTGYVMSSK